MKSIREIYKIGKGPSSSHTMGPERAAQLFKDKHPGADGFRVVLYGSLSKTGVGHGTDRVIQAVLSPLPTEIVFSKESPEGFHPNTMDFFALREGKEIGNLLRMAHGCTENHRALIPDVVEPCIHDEPVPLRHKDAAFQIPDVVLHAVAESFSIHSSNYSPSFVFH